jgi:hypothetical protein
VRRYAFAWRNLVATDFGDNHGAVRSDTQLGTVRITDPDPFLESEGGLQPPNGGSHVRINENRCHGGGRRRTISEHGRTLTGVPLGGL